MDPFFWSWLYVFASNTWEGRLNFSCNSLAHWRRSEAGQMINSLRFLSAHNWQSTNPASMVLPKPTSSASTTPLLSGFSIAKEPPQFDEDLDLRLHQTAIETDGPPHCLNGEWKVHAQNISHDKVLYQSSFLSLRCTFDDNLLNWIKIVKGYANSGWSLK